MTAPTVLDRFEAAILAGIDRFAAMTGPEFMRAAVEIVREDGWRSGRTLIDELRRVAAAGSIDAAAAFIIFASRDEELGGQIVGVLESLTSRFGDLMEEARLSPRWSPVARGRAAL